MQHDARRTFQTELPTTDGLKEFGRKEVCTPVIREV
jgi:hypothetical protein